MEGAVGVIGAGRIAQALGCLLRKRGAAIAGVVSRNRLHAEEAARFIGPGTEALDYDQLLRRTETLLIAVSDDAVSTVAERLAEAGISGGVVIHTAGVYGPEVLHVIGRRGVSCGSLHPLQTVATPAQGVADLPGSPFAVAAEGAAEETARRWVGLLNGKLLSLEPGTKPLYHAAAVMASNYTAALLDAALVLMDAAGVEAEDALSALGPLVKTSVENVLAQGPATALTGPLRRGDLRTVELHLGAMAEARIPETVQSLYRAAGLETVRLAAQGGLGARVVEKAEAILKGEVHETGSSPRSRNHEVQG